MKKLITVLIIFHTIISLKSQNIECTGNLISIPLSGYKAGDIQWQFSNDTANWTAIADQTTTTLEYIILETGCIRAMVSYGACEYYSDTTFIEVYPIAVANAGEDKLYSNIDTVVTLSANNPIVGKGKWTIISGAGGSFENDTVSDTQFTGYTDSDYLLKWTISTQCDTTVDSVAIFFGDTVEDFQGNVYKIKQIGTQIWMIDNLTTTKFNDGTPITNVTDDATWAISTDPGYCWYDDDSTTYAPDYGALYNWYTINTSNLCPTGWHVPSKDEWTVLINYAGGEAVAGAALKETGTAHWLSPNANVTNSTGFTALPGGRRDGDFGSSFIGMYGTYWSSTTSNTTNAYVVSLGYNSINAVFNSFSKKWGQSVRCLKD